MSLLPNNKSALLAALDSNIVASNIELKMLAETEITGFSIDSRTIKDGHVFIALIGNNFDGHRFIYDALAKGASYVISQRNKEDIRTLITAGNESTTCDLDSHLIEVDDVEKALVNIAKFSRHNSKAKFIGLTGSVGKTTTKELLKIALGANSQVFATPGNLNNHLGLPLSLANMNHDCELGIFELGMNAPKEIAYLSNILKPNIAIITNIFNNHIASFNNEQEICDEKADIFVGFAKDKDCYAIINRDSKYFSSLKAKALSYNATIISFGSHPESNVHILSHTNTQNDIAVVEYKIDDINHTGSYILHSINEGIITNSAIVMAVAYILNLDFMTIHKAIENFRPLDGRGKIFTLDLNSVGQHKIISVIDDSYNSAPKSLESAITAFARQQRQGGRKIAVIGDMLELGQDSKKYHEEIAPYIVNSDIDIVITVGDNSQHIQDKLPTAQYPYNQHFSTPADLQKKIIDFIRDNDSLLIKASRGIGLDIIVKYLIAMSWDKAS